MPTVTEQIQDIKDQWGDRLLILGHHYQRSSVIQHADERGDSLELARKAAACGDAEKIVFCGVRFMAESADMLSGPGQSVYMPETSAGCPMADMATSGDMESAWCELNDVVGDWRPVVYVNSSATVKACCGRHGGSTCTSSNATRIFKWVLDQGERVFFLPDEHLGVNTARDLGVPADAIAVYDPRLPLGGLTPEAVEAARVVVWKGYCIVHQAFGVDPVKQVRQHLPDATIIVHPETPRDVVEAVDAHGSTAQIIDYVRAMPDGSTVVVGTELNLVQRLAQEQRDRISVKALAPSVCANMAKTNEENLLQTLIEWPESQVIQVPDCIAVDARLALQTMLAM